MATKIEEYAKLQRDVAEVDEWMKLIGDRYEGGGGGYGHLKPANVNITVDIYHQAYNGDNNYHKIPKDLKAELEQLVAGQIPGLLAKARELQRERLLKLRAASVSEYRALMVAAGVGIDPGV